MNKQRLNALKPIASICILAILAIQSLLPLTSLAVTPDNIIQYQGRLLNANGVPVSASSASVLFEFYDAQAGGTCLWSNSSSTCASATARTVTLTEGLFSEPLGNTTIGVPYAAIPDDVFGDDASVYLQVTINGETLTPRKRALSSPYAINSSLVDGLDTTTTGSTSSAIPALDANGALVVTGNPSGAGVSQGSVYVNPAAVDTPVNGTIFGVANGGTELFRVDAEGDIFIGGFALNGTSGTAGAQLVGVDSGAFTQSAGDDVQEVLLDFDGAIDALAAGSSKWTDDGTFTYLTNTSDDFVVGSGATATAPLFFDTSAETLYVGSDTDEGSIMLRGDAFGGALLAVDPSGNFTVSSSQFDINGAGDVITDGSLIADGGLSLYTLGDIYSDDPTFSFLDNATASTDINFGGVSADVSNNIQMATESTSPDTIFIGNSNASTIMELTGGDDWSITQGGDATFINVIGNLGNFLDLALNGGDVYSNGTTLNFLDGGGSTTDIDIGGVDNSIANVIRIATNSTAADTLTFGNSHASTLFTLTGGNDWNIQSTGDANFESITVADSSGILINPYDTLPGTTSGLYFFELVANGTHAVGFKAPDSIAGDTTWTLPSGDGGNGDVLTTNGSGTLSWTTPGVAADSLDFDDFLDSMTLDAALNVTAAHHTIWNLTGAGDFEIQDNGSQVFSIEEDGTAAFFDILTVSQEVSPTTVETTEINVTQTHDTTSSVLTLGVNNSAIASTGTNYFMNLVNYDDAGATGSYDSFIRLSNNDTNESIGFGLELVGTGGYGVGISLSDTSIATGIDLGDNDIIGDNAVIDFTNFDVDGLGNVTASDFLCTGCLDYDAFDFQLNLDESTDLALGTFQYNLEIDDAGSYYVAMTGTGDFVIQDTGSPFAAFNNGALIDFTAAAAGSDFIDVDANVVSTAVAFDLGVSGLTTGNGLQVASSSTVLSSGNLADLSHSATYTSTGTVSGNIAEMTRTVVNNTGGALTISGPVVQIISNNSNSSGTLTDSANVLYAGQGNSGATGAAVLFENQGTGSTLNIRQTAPTGSTVSDVLGGALHIGNTGNDDYGLTVYSNEGTSTNPLAYIFADNTAFDNHVFHVENDSTQTNSSAVRIEQNTVSDSSTTTNFALLVDTNEVAGNDELVVFRSDADGTPDIEFRFEADGDAFADGAFTGGGADLAEWMISSDAGLGGNDVVCRDESTLNGVKECAPGEKSIVGAISTNPGFVGNYQESFDGGIPANYRLVGLIGQIDVSASAADGSIAVGDLVTTSSSVAGAVGKASGPSRVLGYALEPLSSGTGVIKVLVQPTWSAEGTIASDGSAIVMRETFALASLGTANISQNYGSELLSFRGSAWNGTSAQTVSMGLEAMVDSASAYRLAVTDSSGTEVASINQSGDLALAGRFYPSDSGVMQNSAYIYYDSSGLGYMRTNAAGWSTGSYDFAEMFPSPDALVPGEVVVFGSAREQMTRSTGKKYDDRIAGIVSTRPGFLAGEWRDGEYPIALSGRVPTFVTTENGAIKVGDPLTTSSTPGYAMKATQPGPIVGYAMEDYASGEGSIVVFVRASYYDGVATNPAPAADTAISGLATSSVASLDITGTLNMNGGSIFSVGSIQGAGGTWSIAESGDITTEGRLIQIVRSYQNEDVATYAAASREMTVQLSGTATLQNGVAVVNLETVDPKFNDVISNEVPYRVFVTPNGATGQISVTNREQASFVIRDTSGADGILVDWLVIGTHKDYAQPSVIIEEPEVPEVPADNLGEQGESENEESEEEVIDENTDAPPSEDGIQEQDEVTEETDTDSSDETEEVTQESEEEPVPETEEVPEVVEETEVIGEELVDEEAQIIP